MNHVIMKFLFVSVIGIVAQTALGQPTAPGIPLPARPPLPNELAANPMVMRAYRELQAQSMGPANGDEAYDGHANGFVAGFNFGSPNDSCPVDRPYCMSLSGGGLEDTSVDTVEKKSVEAAEMDPVFNKEVEVGVLTTRNAIAGHRDAHSPVTANMINSTIASPVTVYLAAIGMTDSGVLAGLTGGNQIAGAITTNMLLGEQNYLKQMELNPALRDMQISDYVRCTYKEMGSLDADPSHPKEGWLSAVSRCMGGERTGLAPGGDSVVPTKAWNPRNLANKNPASLKDRAAQKLEIGACAAMLFSVDELNPTTRDNVATHSTVDEMINANFCPLLTSITNVAVRGKLIDVAKHWRSALRDMFGDLKWRENVAGGQVYSESNDKTQITLENVPASIGLGSFQKAFVREAYENLHRVLYMYCKFQNREDMPNSVDMGSPADPDMAPVSRAYRQTAHNPYDAYDLVLNYDTVNLRSDFFGMLVKDWWRTGSNNAQARSSSALAKISLPGQPITPPVIKGLFQLFRDDRVSDSQAKLPCDELQVWDSSNRDSIDSLMHAALNSAKPRPRTSTYMAYASVVGTAQLALIISYAESFLERISRTGKESFARVYGQQLIQAEAGAMQKPGEIYRGLLEKLPGSVREYLSSMPRFGGARIGASFAASTDDSVGAQGVLGNP